MARSHQWMFRLVDRVTNPVRAMTAALRQFRAQLTAVQRLLRGGLTWGGGGGGGSGGGTAGVTRQARAMAGLERATRSYSRAASEVATRHSRAARAQRELQVTAARTRTSLAGGARAADAMGAGVRNLERRVSGARRSLGGGGGGGAPVLGLPVAGLPAVGLPGAGGILGKDGRVRDNGGRFLPGGGGAGGGGGGRKKREKESFDAIGEAADLAIIPVKALGVAILAVSAATVGLGVAGAKFAADTLMFKENTLAGLKVMLGTEQAAQEVFNEALAFAKKTPFDTKDVVQGYTSLLGAGFSRDQVGKVYSALGDVAAMSGFDKEVIDRLTTSFAQIKAKGKLQGEEMLQVLEVSGKAGVGATAVYAQIAKKLGIATADVSKAISAGKVDSDTGILAILETIQQRSGGKVGNIMLEQSKTLAGLWSTLASAPGDFLMSMDLSKLSGFEALKGFIQNLVSIFDSSSVAGQRMTGVMMKLVNVVFGSLFGSGASAGGLTSMQDTILRITASVDKMIPGLEKGLLVVRGILSGFFGGMLDKMDKMSGLGESMSSMMTPEGAENLGRSMGEAASKIMTVINALYMLVTPIIVIMDQFSQLNTWFSSLGNGWGASIAKGLWQGIIDSMNWPMTAIELMVNGVTGVYKTLTDTHSPSRLFARYGGWAVEGYSRGIMQQTPNAEGAMGDMVDAVAFTTPFGPRATLPGAGGGEGAGAAAGGRGGMQLSIGSLVIQTGGHVPGDPDSQRRLTEDVRMALQQALEQLGVQLGVA